MAPRSWETARTGNLPGPADTLLIVWGDPHQASGPRTRGEYACGDLSPSLWLPVTAVLGGDAAPGCRCGAGHAHAHTLGILSIRTRVIPTPSSPASLARFQTPDCLSTPSLEPNTKDLTLAVPKRSLWVPVPSPAVCLPHLRPVTQTTPWSHPGPHPPWQSLPAQPSKHTHHGLSPAPAIPPWGPPGLHRVFSNEPAGAPSPPLLHAGPPAAPSPFQRGTSRGLRLL